MNAEQAKALLASITPGPWEIDGIAIAGNDERAGDVCYMGEPAQYAGDTARMLNNWDANARAIAALPDALATVVADAEEKARMAARIEALEAEKAVNEKALALWRTAFWVSDKYAVAIHDDAGKFYSIRAQDFHRMSDLYRGDIDAASAALAQGERA